MREMKFDRVSDNRRAYFISILFHGALLLLLLAFPVSIKLVEQPKFYELNLGTISSQRMEQILAESHRAEAAAKQHREDMSPRERVAVPKRRMVELEEPPTTVPEPRKVQSEDTVRKDERLKQELTSPRPVVPSTAREIHSSEHKATFEGSKITMGESQPVRAEAGGNGKTISTAVAGGDVKSANSAEAGASGESAIAGPATGPIGEDVARNFQIEGDIKGRNVIFNPLPVYPEGLNRSATIKISFTVLPDGGVSPTGMIPIRKENATLEELTMNMLKRWRFTPLPAGDTRNQKGIITFYYKVR